MHHQNLFPFSAWVPRFAPLALSLAGAVPAGWGAYAPELSLSLSGVADETVATGEPLQVTVRIEAPATFTGAWTLAPASGTWADAVAVEILPQGRNEPAARGVVVGKPDQPHATLDRERIAGGLWRFPPEAMQRLAPGSYRVRAKLTVRDGSGWKGAAESEELPLTVIAPSNAPERAGFRSLALARDAFLAGENEKAAKLLDAELTREPQNFRLLLLRAAVAERVGNFPAAQLCLNVARRSVGENAAGYPNVELEELSGRVMAGLMRPPASAGQADPPAWSWPPDSVVRALPELAASGGAGTTGAPASAAGAAPASVPASAPPVAAGIAPAASASTPPAGAAPAPSLVTLNVNLNLGGSAAGTAAPAVPSDSSSSVIRSLPGASPTAAPGSSAPTAPAPAAVASAPAAGPAVVSGVVPASHVTDPKAQADAAGQWAVSARAGSQYGTAERSAARATGAPDVPGADDHPNAWCPATRDRGTDWLELTFARAVPATEVRVRQNHGPGAITKVEVIEPNGRSHVWWEGVDPFGQDGLARDAVWFTVRVPRTAYAVQKIKLTLNLAAHTRWKQIDAVQLIEAQVSEVVVAPVQVPVSVSSTAPVTAPAAAAAPLPTGVVPAAQLNDANVQADAAGQWSTGARASSQYGSAERSAARATGAPDVPGADDHPNAWCPATRDRGVDWIELTFARPVRASEVRVRQNNGPGAITKVEAIDAGEQSHVWWEGVDPYGQEGLARDAVWFAVRVQPTTYAVARIKLTLNLGAHTRWKQIDAVQLVEAPLTLSGISSPAAPTATAAPPPSPATSPAPVPAPPASPLNSLVRKLTEKRAAGTAATAPRKEDLLRPEFRFRRSAEWLVLPALARQLSTNDNERIAVLDLLVKGVTETSRLLAAEGADNDIAAVTALYFTQLWGVARQREVPEAGADALHAQIVAALAGPEVAAMSDADKQRYWEYCLGLPIFVLGMREVATEPAAQADLRTIAAAAFEVLLGVRPELVDIGNEGLKLAAGVEESLAAPPMSPAGPAPTQSSENPVSSPPANSGYRFTTSSFDDGWVSTVQDDYILVAKGDNSVYLLFQVPYDSSRFSGTGLRDAEYYWDNYVTRYFTTDSKRFNDGGSIALKPPYMEGNATEKRTGRACFVGMYLLIVPNATKLVIGTAPDEQAFRALYPKANDFSMSDLGAMERYNKFAVGPGDIVGKWQEGGTNAAQWYYTSPSGYEGYAGMTAAATSATFIFNGNGTYISIHNGATGAVGSMNTFQQEYKGNYNVTNWSIAATNRWQGKTDTFDASFVAVKGGRILQLNNGAGQKYSLVRVR
jgi:hypothetical protein